MSKKNEFHKHNVQNGWATSANETGFLIPEDKLNKLNRPIGKKNELFSKNSAAREGTERLLKSFLDIAILSELSRREMMSGPNLISYFKAKFNIKLSPGTLYPVLKKMKASECISFVCRRKIKFYYIAQNGLKKVEDFRESLDNIEDNLFELFRVNYWEFVIEITRKISS